MKLNNLFEGSSQSKNIIMLRTVHGQPVLYPNGQRREIWNLDFICRAKGLTSLEGSPKEICGDFVASSNHLSSLEDGPEIVRGNLLLTDNNFTSLKNIHKYLLQVDGIIDFKENPISSNVLGLLKIKNLKKVRFGGYDGYQLQGIINKYLPEGDILECQNELIDARLSEYAKL